MSESNSAVAEQMKLDGNDYRNWPLVSGLLVMVLSAVLSYYAHQPPPPKPVDVADDVFSAMRADQHLKTLVADGIPHPAGSSQNQIVRQRVQDILESMGYETEIQTTSSAPFVLDNKGPFPLTNVIAALPGNGKYQGQPRSKIALVSHYDSHPAGPGASDDGVGTAALLEIAGMLKRQSGKRPFDRDIVFLITDGEEYGLLGAKKFVKEHPLAKEIGAVVNLEARGSSGASLMFQSGSESRWLIEQFADRCAIPRTSSLFYEVYRRMPNDTDFTVFDRDGAQGYNFAFIGDVKHYHTPQDTYENADRGSLQHHGQNALAMIQALANLDIQNQPKGRAVYFDVQGRQIIWWPETWSFVMSLVTAGVLLLFAVVSIRRNRLSLTGALIGVGLALMFVVAIALSGILLSMGFRLDKRFELAWPNSPVPMAMSFWFLAISTIGILSSVFRSPQRFEQSNFGVIFIWVVLATASSIMMTGASYLFIVPVMGMCLFGLMTALFGNRNSNSFSSLAIVVALIVLCLIWLPTEFLFYDVIGFKTVTLPFAGRVMLLPVIRATVVTSALIPLFFVATRSFRTLTSGVFLGATIVSLIWAVLTNG